MNYLYRQIAALKSGKIGGYASDVMEEELVDEGLDTKFHSPLIECDNFIISPHLGAQTVDASRKGADVRENSLEDAFALAMGKS